MALVRGARIPTHVGIYYHYDSNEGEHVYGFKVGTRNQFERRKHGFLAETKAKPQTQVLVKLLPLRKPHRKELAPFYQELGGQRFHLGDISYRKTPISLVSNSVYPKYNLSKEPRNLLSGLGGILEAAALGHLQKIGARLTNTGNDVRLPRKKQLRRSQLPIRTDVRFSTWRSKLLKASWRALKRSERRKASARLK